MGTTHIKMTDVDKCLMCGKHIGFGNDPAVCSKECGKRLMVEVEFEWWARKQANDRASLGG